MSEAFGAYDTASTSAHVPDGTYTVAVRSVQVVKRNGEPVRDQKSNKVKVAIVVAVLGGPQNSADLKRTTTIAYGANSESGAYATFAQFIEAATGVKCGDPEQKKIGEEQLKGRKLEVVVLENSKGYADIVRFRQLKDAPPAREWDPTQQDVGHRGQRERHAASESAQEVDLLSRLPLPRRNQIEQLAKVKKVDPPRLRVLIGSIAGPSAPLAPEDVEKLVEMLKKERAA